MDLPAAKMDLSGNNKKKCRLSYSITFKLSAVRHAEMNGNRATARYLGINEKQIRDWRAKKISLMSTNCNAKRLKGAGRQASEFSKIKAAASMVSSLKESKSTLSRNAFMNNMQPNDRIYPTYKQTGWTNRLKQGHPIIMRPDSSELVTGFHPSMVMCGHRFNHAVSKNLEKEREFHERITCALALLDLKSAMSNHKYATPTK